MATPKTGGNLLIAPVFGRVATIQPMSRPLLYPYNKLADSERSELAQSLLSFAEQSEVSIIGQKIS